MQLLTCLSSGRACTFSTRLLGAGAHWLPPVLTRAQQQHDFPVKLFIVRSCSSLTRQGEPIYSGVNVLRSNAQVVQMYKSRPGLHLVQICRPAGVPAQGLQTPPWICTTCVHSDRTNVQCVAYDQDIGT